jgi:hypothetical protein
MFRSRLDDMPRYSTEPCTLDAALFNQVRLAMLRFSQPLRFPLAGLRHLEMVIEEDTWVCIDNSLNDFPILAWVDFDAHHRDSLHEPVACTLYTYHCHADMITDRVLKLTTDHLDQRLHRKDDQNGKD